MNIKCLDRTRYLIFKAKRNIMTEFSYEHGKKKKFFILLDLQNANVIWGDNPLNYNDFWSHFHCFDMIIT